MFDFLHKLFTGDASGEEKYPNQIQTSAEERYEQKQMKELFDIVDTVRRILDNHPSSEDLQTYLKNLKKIFDCIDFSGIKSQEGIANYHKVENIFKQYLRQEEKDRKILEEGRKQLEEPNLSFCFDGKNVSETNFYDTVWNRRGLLYCVGDSDTLHLFLPDQTSNGIPCVSILNEVDSAEYVIASVCRDEHSGFYLEILFEDHSESPYALFLSKKQVAPALSMEDEGRSGLACQLHIGPFGETAKKFPLRLRFVNSLPYMKPWGQ